MKLTALYVHVTLENSGSSDSSVFLCVQHMGNKGRVYVQELCENGSQE